METLPNVSNEDVMFSQIWIRIGGIFRIAALVSFQLLESIYCWWNKNEISIVVPPLLQLISMTRIDGANLVSKGYFAESLSDCRHLN